MPKPAPAAPSMHGAELFDRYRKAKPGGPLRRLLADQLLRLNEGLVVKLCAQLLGRDKDGNRTGSRFRHPTGRVYDADLLEWEDAMQIARMAFARALESFDPRKASIAWYARWWVKDYLDRTTCISAPITTPQKKNDQRPSCEVLSPLPPRSGDGPETVRWLGQHLGTVEDGPVALEGLTPDMVSEWERTGEWPETLVEAIEREEPTESPVPTRPLLDRFVDEQLVFASAGRVPTVTLHARFERAALTEGAPVDRRGLQARIRDRGVRASRMRVPWSLTPVACYAGVRLQPAAH